MWQKELINLGIDAGKKIVKAARQTAPKTVFGRAIKQAGNGKSRVIVGGFTGPNLDAVNHNKLVQRRISMNIRPVVTGFTGIPGVLKLKQMTGMPNRGGLRFFPNFRLPKMTRHVVHDIQTTRKAVVGFTTENMQKTDFVTNGSPIVPGQPVKKPEVVTERVVVQGFGGNSAQKIYKTMEQDKNTQRTVVKGFRA